MSDTIIQLSPPEKVEMADEWFELVTSDHFWIEWRFNIIRKYASIIASNTSKILEIGCGNGVVLKQFNEQLNKSVDGCDLNLYALNMIKDVPGKKYVYNIYDLDKQLVNQYDTVILLDVVEHIGNDVEFLKTASKHLKPGGHVLINVPALQSLFSRYDTQAGHQRRYNKKSLRSLCNNAGLDLVGLEYWGLSLLPMAFIRKFILLAVAQDKIIETGFKPPAPWMHKVFKFMMRIETKLFKSPFLGSSLVMVAKTKG